MEHLEKKALKSRMENSLLNGFLMTSSMVWAEGDKGELPPLFFFLFSVFKKEVNVSLSFIKSRGGGNK